jgi:protoporphyrin/coproporphyrin ferrochelatase
MQTKPTIGVLLMAYGSPDSLDELEPYLLDIRGGRPVSPELLAEMKKRYTLIGGRSPLLDLTCAQARALETELNHRFDGKGINFRTYVGMRHWQPRIREAVVQMNADGIKRMVALVMAPHSSRLSTGAYFGRLQEAIDELGIEMAVDRIESWYNHPGLIAALAEKVSTALQLFTPIEPYIIFTAHSLPARILEQGDLYDSQLRETASLLVERLGIPTNQWEFCYQSAGHSPEPWLGPSIEQRILALVQSGQKNLLVVPVGFVCDHVEVLYDIDIAGRNLASANGARLERSESLNASPTLIAALVDLVTNTFSTPG